MKNLDLDAIKAEKDTIPEGQAPCDEKAFAEEKLVERMGYYEKKKHDETVFIKDVTGAGGGALLGVSVGGPLGAIVGGIAGFILSYSLNHDHKRD